MRWKMLQRALLSLIVICAGAFSALTCSSEALASEAAKPDLDIVMYSTRTCGYCAQARDWFENQNLTWEERDIETSEVARAEWQAQGGRGTPLILINGRRFSGFSPEQLSEELAKYR
ncbi:glutaredoxin family protein [Dokdonella sp.]|uniref:glutaredoxin family protein n=1 Tax=Dokdonella sp. TaxID=2291710 RepID=UPI0035287802